MHSGSQAVRRRYPCLPQAALAFREFVLGISARSRRRGCQNRHHTFILLSFLSATIRAEIPRGNKLEVENASVKPPVEWPKSPNSPASTIKIVAIAASVGGLKAITKILTGLPSNFPDQARFHTSDKVEVPEGIHLLWMPPKSPVQHLHPKHRSLMAEILERQTSLPVRQAEEGNSLSPGTVYIAPPDYHPLFDGRDFRAADFFLVNADDTLSLNQSKAQHFVRPSAEMLFNSVANSYGERAIAVVLTGAGKDGITGVQTIHQQGGIVIAQDEKTSECFSMPNTAIQTGIVDFILPLPSIAAKLVSLVSES